MLSRTTLQKSGEERQLKTAECIRRFVVSQRLLLVFLEIDLHHGVGPRTPVDGVVELLQADRPIAHQYPHGSLGRILQDADLGLLSVFQDRFARGLRAEAVAGKTLLDLDHDRVLLDFRHRDGRALPIDLCHNGDGAEGDDENIHTDGIGLGHVSFLLEGC